MEAIMKHKLSVSNKLIRKESGKILEGNIWSYIGAWILLSIISGIFGGGGTTLFSTTDGQNGEIAVTIMSIVSIVLQVMFTFGIIWGTIHMVDHQKFSFKKLFKPWTQRGFRNFGIGIIYQLFFGFLIALAMIIVAALFWGTFVTLFNSVGSLNNVGSLVNQIGEVDLGSSIAFLAVVTSSIIIGLISLFFYYRWVFVHYIPYDNNQTGVFKAFSVSSTMMKGNKFKLFRIHFYYGFLMFLFYALVGIVIFLSGYLVDAPVIPAILGVIMGVAALIVSIILTLRSRTATALFYRLITDEYGEIYDEKYPFLDMAPAKEEPEYHSEPRPEFAAATTAITPGSHVQTEPAANYDENEEDQSAHTSHQPISDEEIATNDDMHSDDTMVYPENKETIADDSFEEDSSPVYSAYDPMSTVSDDNQDEEIAADGEVVDDIESSKKETQSNPDFEAYEDTNVADETESDNEEFVNLAHNETGISDASLDDTEFFTSDQVEEDEVLDEKDDENPSKGIEPSADQMNLAHEKTGVNTTPDTDETPEEEKVPYSIMGYNTPKRTKFNEVENEKDVLYAAEKAQTDDATGVSFDEEDDK